MNFKGNTFEELQDKLRLSIDERMGREWQLIDGFANMPCFNSHPPDFQKFILDPKVVPAVLVLNKYTSEIRMLSATLLLEDNQ